MTDERLTIGELASTTGVATSALRYWEELGLMPAPVRRSGQRRYPASSVRLVGMILLLREVGFALREVKELIVAPSGDPETWRELHQRKLAELDERIARAQTARTAIAHGLACPHQDTVRQCPTFDATLTAWLDGLPLHEAHEH